jgi:hypothetical protein
MVTVVPFAVAELNDFANEGKTYTLCLSVIATNERSPA